MLGSLARKLRILGFDTLYFQSGTDEELESLARGDGRIVLTRDRAVLERSRTGRFEAVGVEGRTDAERLRSLASKTRLAVGPRGEWQSRCAVCNGALRVVARGELGLGEVPERVLKRHRLFYRCESCSRTFWRGGHWARIGRIARPLRPKGQAPGGGRARRPRRRSP